jgi:hypothetical protein
LQVDNHSRFYPQIDPQANATYPSKSYRFVNCFRNFNICNQKVNKGWQVRSLIRANTQHTLGLCNDNGTSHGRIEVNHILAMLDQLRRPRLLIQAARIGAVDYRRDIHLRRHLGHGPLPRSGESLMQLIEKEAQLDSQRRSGEASYSVSEHVEVLIAMMGEARLMRAAHF